MQAANRIDRNDTLWETNKGEHMPAEAWVGCAVGTRHRLIKHLGSGGMGHVFLAEHRTLGANAAVKILATRCTRPVIERFLAEAKLLAALNHANIVKVFDVGEMDDDSPYILMEYAPGVDLGEWLRRNEELSVKRALRILRQVACAVDHLHAQGIVHRDIKPANIMVDPEANDAVKLIDFGIAIREGTKDSCFEQGLLGTPAYMAPEQVEGSGCGKAADLYALGALALELLTGKPPYDYPSLNLMLAAVLEESPALPSTRGIAIPGCDAVIERALARDPRARYASGGEFVDALTAVLSAAWSTRAAAAGQRPRRAERSGRQATRRTPRTPTTGRSSLVRGAFALASAALAWLA